MTRDAASGAELPRSLRELARARGVQLAYRDVEGHRRTASRETVLAVLRALGTDVDDAGGAREAHRRLRLRRWRRVVEPVAVAWRRDGGEIRLRLPEDAGRPACRLRLEDGGEVDVAEPGTREGEGDPLAVVGSERVEGRAYVERRLELPGRLPAGYHRLVVEAGESRGEALVICAPSRAWHPPAVHRRWGVFAPTWALRSEAGGEPAEGDAADAADAEAGNGGAGHLGHLRRLMRWTAERGGDYTGTLPLLSTYLDEPFDPSPYAPVSRLFWNELYLDPERVPGAGEAESGSARSPERPAPAGSPGKPGEAGQPGEARWVDYRRVAARRRRRLEPLAERFFDSGGESTSSFRRFLREHPRSREYARFRAVADRRRAGWPEWPERLRGGDLREGDHDPEDVRYHLFVQWAAERQMRELAGEGRSRGTELYLDLPLGCHSAGFDVWREREAFAPGASVGSPPDDFFEQGQDWGFPPPHPERARERGYAYEIDALRHSMRPAGILRIDHVMGLHRLYWVPAGRPATEGAYVRYRSEERYAILCLESHRNETLLVGEDLGTVPGEVRDTMEERGVDRMFVAQMELRPDAPALPEPPARSLAGLNTHDLHPFAGFWTGRDIEVRQRAGLLDGEGEVDARRERERLRASLVRLLRREGLLPPAEPQPGEGDDGPSERAVREASLAWLAAGPARTVMLNLEDLWGETRAQNLPGRSGEESWRRRAKMTLEAMERSDGIDRLLERLREARRGAPVRAEVGAAPGSGAPGAAGADSP